MKQKEKTVNLRTNPPALPISISSVFVQRSVLLLTSFRQCKRHIKAYCTKVLYGMARGAFPYVNSSTSDEPSVCHTHTSADGIC